MSSGNDGSATSQPSSILFFIAVAIGVLIALIFIFFSMRYYVRTRLGIYATARLTSTSPNGGIVLLTGDFPMHTFNAYSGDLPTQMIRRRRRGKYLKKRRLTEEEVDHLFPIRTYRDWLDGGAERDASQRDINEELKQENDEEVVDHVEEFTENTANDNNEPNEQTAQTNTNDTDSGSSYQNVIDTEVDLGTPYEPHYDSGTCAICIDTFEPEELVRGLICGHVFHQECLDPWLIKRKACCPMCKRDYYLKDGNGEQNNADGTTAAGVETTGQHNDDDMDSVNQFTELQYTTLSERVTEILSRHPQLEECATTKIEKYLQFKWRIFWFVMGISRKDLINSAIINEDQRMRDEDSNWDNTNATGNNSTENTSGENSADATNVSNHATAEQYRERVERMV